jgi:hypothetical protein
MSKSMTLEQCQARLAEIRLKQGTSRPIVRVEFRGTTFLGLVVEPDPERKNVRRSPVPYGLLVLETPGLVPGPQTMIQIAALAENAIQEAEAIA